MLKRLPKNLRTFEERITPELKKLAAIQDRIKRELSRYSDGKPLKGDEVVGRLGEICGKLLLGGTLVGEEHEHDIEKGRMRISVKARKGGRRGWTQTSAIPKIEGAGCPTHLIFVHFTDAYQLQSIWLYPWPELSKRFKDKMVRGQRSSYIFKVDPKKDQKYLKYQREEV